MGNIKEQVKHIVETIENGVPVNDECPNCGNDLDEGYCEECGEDFSDEIMSGFDYLQDVLDIEWILHSDRTLKGARLLVCCGGPNIWIDTVNGVVDGHWWGDSYTESYSSDAMDIAGCVEELFSC